MWISLEELSISEGGKSECALGVKGLEKDCLDQGA